ncbi:hypothetical protein C0993_003979 [Termitomyces sp. T159_Od127]|nr:hypothetical protein C0993_003979 [Termitomyces sp. T159_Od127]
MLLTSLTGLVPTSSIWRSIAITGLVVLGGHTRVADPYANFRNSFVDTTSNGNGLATALVKVNFAYAGFENAFNVLHEVRDPVRTVKRYCIAKLIIDSAAVVDLQSYPANVFRFLLTAGLLLVRRRRAKTGAPTTDFRVWSIVLIFAISVNIYLLVLPWVPPEGGVYNGDVSFFYATYCFAGIGVLVVSGLGYLLYIHILPTLGGYAIRQLVKNLDNGATTNKLVRVPNAELEKWDSIHNEHGEVIEQRS